MVLNLMRDLHSTELSRFDLRSQCEFSWTSAVIGIRNEVANNPGSFPSWSSNRIKKKHFFISRRENGNAYIINFTYNEIFVIFCSIFWCSMNRIPVRKDIIVRLSEEHGMTSGPMACATTNEWLNDYSFLAKKKPRHMNCLDRLAELSYLPINRMAMDNNNPGANTNANAQCSSSAWLRQAQSKFHQYRVELCSITFTRMICNNVRLLTPFSTIATGPRPSGVLADAGNPHWPVPAIIGVSSTKRTWLKRKMKRRYDGTSSIAPWCAIARSGSHRLLVYTIDILCELVLSHRMFRIRILPKPNAVSVIGTMDTFSPFARIVLGVFAGANDQPADRRNSVGKVQTSHMNMNIYMNNASGLLFTI